MRTLPKKNNPLIQADVAPDHLDLVARRRLGKTKLSVKPAQIGTSNATMPENLGDFEYAHLRAPLPKDLKGSEIFPAKPTSNPDTYFLMRRSRDGYVSATGMFKIAFPWAKYAEELSEREHLRTRRGISEDDVAGNVWISPELALDLAKEYKMSNWVRALLDPTEISQNSGTQDTIRPPPTFELPAIDGALFAPPETRGRARRSASPSKSAFAARKIATPRNRRTRGQKESSVTPSAAANTSLQNSLDAAAAASTETPTKVKQFRANRVEVNGETPSSEGENGSEDEAEAEADANEEDEEDEEEEEEQVVPVKKSKDHVTVNVESTVDRDSTGDLERSKTNVSVEIPAELPDLPPPEDTEEMIAKAKEMVEEAAKLQKEEEAPAAKKRKAVDLAEDDEDKGTSVQPTKRARGLEDRLRRERVRNRALIGVTATLAAAAAIPYFF